MILTNEDVREWAETMVKANGEKFTPLTKGEQFLIAKYIMSSGEKSSPKVLEGETPPTDTAQERNENPEDTGMVGDGIETLKMTRGAAFHLAGHSPQKAYDEFLSWCRENKTDTSVMDFSTGARSTSAAFAYWLNEVVNVHIHKGE